MAKQEKKERIVRHREGIDITEYKEILYAYADGLTIVSSHPGSRAWWVVKGTPACGRDGRDYAVYQDINYRLRESCGPRGDYYKEHDLCFVCKAVLFKSYYNLEITVLEAQFEHLNEHHVCLCHKCYKKQVLIDFG